MGVAIPPGGLEAKWIDGDQIEYFGDRHPKGGLTSFIP